MIHLVTIIGARPQFIKAAVLSRLIRSEMWKERFRETIIHTGQHYDDNMSEVFFREMEIPEPDIHLNVGSGLHGQMTGTMLIGIEKELIRLKPDLVLVYGDTNSTLAGALAASKLHIPVAHVEAGLRSFYRLMPEEQNRVLTDHLADFLFCPTSTAVQNLVKEGIINGVHETGDIMFDASIYYRDKLNNLLAQSTEHMKRSEIPQGGRAQGTGLRAQGSGHRAQGNQGLEDILNRKDYILATVHRAENTDDPGKLSAIVDAFNRLGKNVILPLHPRTRKLLTEYDLKFKSHVKVIDPVGYFGMLELEMNCSCIVTDSGGVQKEAFFLKKPCITLRDQTEWVETVEIGWNTLAGTDPYKIVRAVENAAVPDTWPAFYGDGHCGEKILKILSDRPD